MVTGTGSTSEQPRTSFKVSTHASMKCNNNNNNNKKKKEGGGGEGGGFPMAHREIVKFESCVPGTPYVIDEEWSLKKKNFDKAQHIIRVQ